VTEELLAQIRRAAQKAAAEDYAKHPLSADVRDRLAVLLRRGETRAVA
jgi:hypothetical protein